MHSDDGLLKDTRVVAKQIQSLRKQAENLGLFVEDRDLLTCPKCRLMEDVTIEGLLIVVRQAAQDMDTGLRFQQLGESGCDWKCPSCGCHFVQKPDSKDHE